MKLKTLLFLWIAVSTASGLEAGELLRARGEKVPEQYIVVFKDGAEASVAGWDLASQVGAVVETTWEAALNGALLSGLTEDGAKELAKHPDVLWVEEDGFVTAGAVQTNAPRGLDRIDQRQLPLDGSYEFHRNGAGINVYVIDSGVRHTHRDFGDRARRDIDFVNDGTTGDCINHGTGVASVIAGDTYAVAKRANLHSIRVFGCERSSPTSRIISAIDWVRVNARRPAVANLSLGGDASSSMDRAVNNLVNSGIFAAVAAGNDAADACDASPARASQAYTVGAIDPTDRRASFSNWGRCLDIFAPGVGIRTASSGCDTCTRSRNGTSSAAPHVAGVAALFLWENPSRSPAQIRAEIEAHLSQVPVADKRSGSPDEVLFGVLIGSLRRPTTVSVVSERCFGAHSVFWSPVAGATRYELYRSANSSFVPQTLLSSGSSTSRHINVSSPTFLRVRACNASGCSSYRPGDAKATIFNGCL